MQIEYLVVSFDDEKRRVRLSLRQADILKALAQDTGCVPDLDGAPDMGPTVPK